MKTYSLHDVREKLFSAVICDALDAMGQRNQSPRAPLANLTTSGALAGRCRTTLWADMFHDDPKPYELELRAVDACQPDDVFIAAAGGSMRSGIWGELLTTASMNSGCIGALVDGAVRDTARMTAMKFPIFARGTSIYDSMNRQRVVDLDVTVEVGGVRIAPGDLIFADGDGIVIVPRQIEAEVLERAWNKVHAENAVRDAIRDGMKATAAYAKFGVL